MTSESFYYRVFMLKAYFNSQGPNSFPNNYFKLYPSFKSHSLSHSLPAFLISQINQNHQGFPQADVGFLAMAFKCILPLVLFHFYTLSPGEGNWFLTTDASTLFCLP